MLLLLFFFQYTFLVLLYVNQQKFNILNLLYICWQNLLAFRLN